MSLGMDAVSDQSTIGSTRLDIQKASNQAGVPIRLLRILPISTVQEVQCEIRSATTAENYICLSYCWGDVASCFITLNGLPTKIRPNLYEFLREATRRGIQDWLWIDALCINQSNAAERNHQVKHMATIYRSAQRVIIWLGAYPPYFDQTFPVSVENRRAFFDSLTTSEQELIMATSQDLDFSSGITRWLSKVTPEATPDFLYCLRAICCNSYFDRVWIIQEFILARASEFWWGGDKFSTVGLQRAVLETRRKYCSTPLDFRDESWPQSICLTAEMLDKVDRFPNFIVQLAGYPDGPPLFDILHLMKPSRCTDKRDRVYALLSLAADGPRFAVDYTERLSELYIRLCRFYSFASTDATQIYSLAALLDVDNVLLTQDLFGTVELPPMFSLTGHTYSRSAEVSRPLGVASPKTTYRVWMLHSRSQCREHWRTEMGLPPGVWRVDSEQCIEDPRYDDPDERSLGGNTLCSICAQLLSSQSPGLQRLRRFGGSDIWLNFSTYPDCVGKGQRIVGLHLADLDASKRGTRQESVRVALEGFPSSDLNLQWLLINGEDCDAFTQPAIFVALRPFCGSPTCPLSKDAWENSPRGIPYDDDGSVDSLFDDL